MNERYQLVIRAIPGNWRTHEIGRLKAVLKALKRGYGFECMSICPLAEGDAPQEPVTSADITKILGELE